MYHRKTLQGLGATSYMTAQQALSAASAGQLPTYIFYLDTAHYTGSANAPYTAQQIAGSYYGQSQVMMGGAPPDAVGGSIGSVQIQWLGTVDQFGSYSAFGYPAGSNRQIPALFIGAEAQALAQQQGSPVAIGMLIQGTSMGTFLSRLASLQALPATTAPTSGTAATTQNTTTAPTMAQSAAMLAQPTSTTVVAAQDASGTPTSYLTVVNSSNPAAAAYVAPASDGAMQPASVDQGIASGQVDPDTLIPTSQSDNIWLLLLGGAILLAAVF